VDLFDGCNLHFYFGQLFKKLNLLISFQCYLKLFLAADNSSAADGTYFLQEYMIPRSSSSFCLYDTRGLSYDSYDSANMLKNWITKGVHHRELIIRFEFLASQY
jgi:hypothetical protein